ncbi:hypothetical protein CupriaWKF_26640 [Cupriavidus sp. WKF15]|uniref:hypothetical protein n=1 Tax=Cupriavidus sp. WKF15 TaxID=3032282 RepID=UPI0023E13AEE|nr:hypothetical protein [Cupriavidus sp. WKF15]WER48368.1 hypothetical protein CupriaWKF_26640 [Cupriavidus sp. WKF15]
MKLATLAAAMLLASTWAEGPACADTLSAEAAAVMSGPILYLPASPSNPGGVNGYDHGRQFDVDIEGDPPAKFQARRDKLTKTMPQKAVVGPKVKSGSYTPAPVPGPN